MSDTKKLKQLGKKKTKYSYNQPSKDILETFENQNPKYFYLVPFICTEFTSLCPKTGQPDFAEFEIIYVPRKKMVESKSLKLYLFSYRNEGSFHEDVTNRIFKDLWGQMNPYYMRIFGNFNIRGGIAIKPLIEAFADDLVSEEPIQRLVDSWDKVKNK